jgi:hypothetical protein
LEATTGAAWAQLCGLSDLQSSLADIGARAKEEFPAIRSSAKRLTEEYLRAPDTPAFLQINCMYDMGACVCQSEARLTLHSSDD